MSKCCALSHHLFARLASALESEEVAELEEGELSECGDEAESLAAWARAAASLQPDGTRLPARRCQVTLFCCAACIDQAGLPTCCVDFPADLQQQQSRAALRAAALARGSTASIPLVISYTFATRPLKPPGLTCEHSQVSRSLSQFSCIVFVSRRRCCSRWACCWGRRSSRAAWRPRRRRPQPASAACWPPSWRSCARCSPAAPRPPAAPRAATLQVQTFRGFREVCSAFGPPGAAGTLSVGEASFKPLLQTCWALSMCMFTFSVRRAAVYKRTQGALPTLWAHTSSRHRQAVITCPLYSHRRRLQPAQQRGPCHHGHEHRRLRGHQAHQPRRLWPRVPGPQEGHRRPLRHQGASGFRVRVPFCINKALQQQREVA